MSESVQWTLLTPLVLTIVLGIIQLGLWGYGRTVALNAAGAGAEEAAPATATRAQAEAAALTIARRGGLTDVGISVDVSGTAGGRARHREGAGPDRRGRHLDHGAGHARQGAGVMRRPRPERGAVTVEFVILLPLLMLLMAVVIGGARVWWARATVAQLADSAARQASISRSAGQAQTSAAQLVHGDATQTGVRCVTGWPTLTLDTSGFGVPVGQAAEVRARVECDVPLSDVLLPGLPGSLLVSGEAVSPLDRFRARG